MADIHTPEKDSPDYTKAKKMVSAMAGRSNRWVTVEQVLIDQYGRLIVKLENQDGSLNERMKQRGYR